MSSAKSSNRGVRRRAGSVGQAGGFTLIELMVALVLGLVLLGGVIGIFTASRQSFRVNEGLARVQESARVAFEMMARDLREAGANPCGARSVANVVRVAGAVPWWADWEAGTVRGFEGSEDTPSTVGFGSAATNRVAGTDAVVALRMILDEGAIKPLESHDVSAQAFNIASAAGYLQADVVTVCDAKSAVIVQLGAVNAGATPNALIYAGGPLNCSLSLGFPTPADCAGAPGKTFGSGSVITKYEPVFWYVGLNPRGGRSLYRMRLTREVVSGAGAAQPVIEEMVPFITNMQIEYLLRDTAAGGALATTWVGAEDAAFAGTNGWSTVNPKQVAAMRLAFTFQSEELVVAGSQPLTRQFIMVASVRARDI